MLKLIRTDAQHPDFIQLVSLLDADLKIRNGDKQEFFTQFNTLQLIQHVLIAYQYSEPIGCGAIKRYNHDTMEVKRMYVKEGYRGSGIATTILQALEAWSKELNYHTCILETGIKQPEAIRLYTKNNYQIFPNYGQYQDVQESICFKKEL